MKVTLDPKPSVKITFDGKINPLTWTEWHLHNGQKVLEITMDPDRARELARQIDEACPGPCSVGEWAHWEIQRLQAQIGALRLENNCLNHLKTENDELRRCIDEAGHLLDNIHTLSTR